MVDELNLQETLTKHLRAMLGRNPTHASTILRWITPNLERIARQSLHRYGRTSQITPAELIDEAWVKAYADGWAIQNRHHFYAIAALAMRSALVDFARRRTTRRRGQGVEHCPSASEATTVATPGNLETLVAIGLQLQRMEKRDPKAARIVDMHHFAGFSLEEIAEICDLTFSQVRYLWERGRNQLRRGLPSAK